MRIDKIMRELKLTLHRHEISPFGSYCETTEDITVEIDETEYHTFTKYTGKSIFEIQDMKIRDTAIKIASDLIKHYGVELTWDKDEEWLFDWDIQEAYDRWGNDMHPINHRILISLDNYDDDFKY